MIHKPRKRDKKTGKLPPMVSPGAMLAEWLRDLESKKKRKRKKQKRSR